MSPENEVLWHCTLEDKAAADEHLLSLERERTELRAVLDQVLRWPLPLGTVEEWALPEWLAEKARAAAGLKQ